MPLILREYPDAKIIVGGTNILGAPWYRKTSYAVIIEKLIKKNNLQGKVFFKGMLDETQMCQQYLKSNLFILPSAIENSPNSLGEAQLLGIPYLSTYCGGTPEIVGNNYEALYRYEEIEMLAKKVCNIFSLKENISKIEVDKFYDKENNALKLLSIYEGIAARI